MDYSLLNRNGRTLFPLITDSFDADRKLPSYADAVRVLIMQRSRREGSMTYYLRSTESSVPHDRAFAWIPSAIIYNYINLCERNKSDCIFDQEILRGILWFKGDQPYVDVFYGSETEGIRSLYKPTKSTKPVVPNKEGKSVMKKVLENNSAAIKNASYLEAGRIGVNKMTKLIKPLLPTQAQPYADTAIGKLIVANAAMIAFDQIQPGNEHLRKLGFAMTTQAYTALLADLNIEGVIDSFVKSADVRKAMAKVSDN